MFSTTKVRKAPGKGAMLQTESARGHNEKV